MKEYTVDKIRNVALVGHGGVGKTSLTEALLYSMGEINRIGKVDDGNTVSDYHPDEIERKISISTSLLHGEWKDWKINVLDTPGYSDFIGETKGTLRVTDLATVVMSGVEGIEVGTEQVIEFADEYEIPRLLYINRMDNEHADFDKVLRSSQERYGNGVVALQFPVNQGEGFNKIVDLLSMELITFESGDKGTYSTSEIPDDLKGKAEKLRDKIVDSAAESDDELMETYFDTETLSDEQILEGLRKGLYQRTVIPVLCGAAEKNYGSHQLLNLFGDLGPSPDSFQKVEGIDPKSQEKKDRKISVDEEVSCLVFKTISEAHVGELSLVKVLSGVLHSGADVLNSTRGGSEKIGQIYILNGKNRKEIGNLSTGDIGALVKLKNTSTGNTLCGKKDPIMFNPIQFPEPVISVAISPKSRGDEEKISNGLHMLHDEDPSFTILQDPELHQTIISGQGDLHLKVIIRGLKG